MVQTAGGNSHVLRSELFSRVSYDSMILTFHIFYFAAYRFNDFDISFQTDSYYSLAYGSPRGNLRSHFKSQPAGQKLDCHIAKFRLKLRCEVTINWYRLDYNAIIFVIGEPFYLILVFSVVIMS